MSRSHDVPQRRVVPLIVGVLVVGGIGFVLGRWSLSSEPAAGAKESVSGVRPTEKPTAHASTSSSARDVASDSAEKKSGWSESRWRDLASQPGSPARNASLAAMIEALAATDPTQAIAIVQAEGNRLLRDQLLQSALRGWSKRAPLDAAKWVLASVHPNEREAALTSVFTGAIAGNPDEAIRAGRILIAEDRGAANGCGSHLIDALCDAGFFEAAVNVAASGDETQRNSWLGGAYAKWATYQPQQAASAAASLTDPALRTLALRGIVGGWSQADPAATIQFVTQLPADELKSGLVSQALQRWTKVDLKAASEWINHNELGVAMDEGVSSVASQDYLKPDVAVSWAESVVDPKRRSETLVAVLRNWSTSDLPAMKRYFETTTQLLPEDRQEIAGVIATLSGQPDSPASTP